MAKQKSKLPEWYRKPWATFVTRLGAIVLIFSTGYYMGEYRKGVASELELMTIKQEFYTRIQEEIRDCQKSELEVYNAKLDNLTKVVEALRKKSK